MQSKKMSVIRIVVRVEESSDSILMLFDHGTVRTLQDFKELICQKLGTSNNEGKLYLHFPTANSYELEELNDASDMGAIQTGDRFTWRVSSNSSNDASSAVASEETATHLSSSSPSSGVVAKSEKQRGAQLSSSSASRKRKRKEPSKHSNQSDDGNGNWNRTDNRTGTNGSSTDNGTGNRTGNRTTNTASTERAQTSRKKPLTSKKNDLNHDWKEWKVKFQRFVVYKQETGSGWVPLRYEVDGVLLGRWAQRQRKKAERNKLEEKRYSLLTDNGFEWTQKRKATSSTIVNGTGNRNHDGNGHRTGVVNGRGTAVDASVNPSSIGASFPTSDDSTGVGTGDDDSSTDDGTNGSNNHCSGRAYEL